MSCRCETHGGRKQGENYRTCRNLAWSDPDHLRGFMRRFLAACLLLLLFGCGDKAKDLYDTAQLEEKRFNKPHATKLYRQIVERISQLALRETGADSFDRVGESALDNYQGISAQTRANDEDLT